MLSLHSLHKKCCNKIAAFLITLGVALALQPSLVLAQSPFPDGTVIADDTGPIWVIINGQKRWIKSPAIMVELGWDKVPLRKISPDEARSIPNGRDLNFAEPEARASLFRSITGDEHDLVKGTNISMTTKFTMTRSGNLVADTHTWTGVLFKGGTVGVEITICNDNLDCWFSDWHSFGVDGCSIGDCDRNDRWRGKVPLDIARTATKYTIQHAHTPKVSWKKAADQAGRINKENREVMAAITAALVKAKSGQ